MKLIGKGWQYRVYDIGNNRVRKTALSKLDSYVRAFGSRYSPTFLRPLKSLSEVSRIEAVGRASILGLSQNTSRFPMELFANPTFLVGISYEQDLVVPLEHYLSEHTLEENKQALKKYVELLITLWKLGIGETVYNFSINNGIDGDGRVVQMDIGELVFSKAEVLKTIHNKTWLTQASYLFMQDGPLKEFYRQCMEENLTAANLDRYWPSSHSE